MHDPLPSHTFSRLLTPSLAFSRLLSPSPAFLQALASGVTTLYGGGTGPNHGTLATTCTPAPSQIQMMLQATDALPMNFGFSAKGNTSHPAGMYDALEAGAAGYKLHEDWGTDHTPCTTHAEHLLTPSHAFSHLLTGLGDDTVIYRHVSHVRRATRRAGVWAACTGKGGLHARRVPTLLLSLLAARPLRLQISVS